MKKLIYILLLNVLFNSVHAQSVFGLWKTVDNEGVSKSIVKIYKSEDGLVEGKVYRILKESERDRKCTKCTGDKNGKPVEGLVILEDMQKDGDKYEGGEITDPEKGKTYDCKIWLDENNPDVLHVRGYIAFFYRTQDWIRVEDMNSVLND
jgi:uncharacterized protein (DUF2147 family)